MNAAILLATVMAIFAMAGTEPDRVDAFVERKMRELHIPGLALAVVKDGKIETKRAYGLASIEFDAPVRTDTPFLLASITKTFTATGIMMLVEEDKIDLDAPISQYLSDAPESWKEICVRHLLTHTSGVKDRFEETDYSLWRLSYSTDAMYKAAQRTPTDFAPGARFQYSDQGYFLLGLVLERVSGKSYGAFLEERIFKPLGMDRSSISSQAEIVKGLASGYTVANGINYHNHRRTEYGLVSHFGVVSTVEDLARYDAALYGEELLEETTLDEMWTPARLGDGSIAQSGIGAYGLGWFLDQRNGHRIVQHAGASGTGLLRLPDDRLTVIVLTNLEQLAGGDAIGIAHAIARIYVPTLSWQASKPIADPDPTFTESFRKEVEAIAQGRVTAGLYAPEYLNVIQPQLAPAAGFLRAMGPLARVELLASVRNDTVRTLRYRVTFERDTLYSGISLNADGKITLLSFEGEEMP